MTRLASHDDRRRGERIALALLGIMALCFVMAEMLTGCAAVDLAVSCAKRAAGCQ